MPATFEMSSESRVLRQRLRQAKIGEVVSYAQLSADVGKAVSGASGALQSARRALLNDEHMVFDVVYGVGVKRLADAEIVAASDRDLAKVRRAAKRGARRLASIGNFAALSPKDQLRYTLGMSVLALVNHTTSDRAAQAIAASASGRASQLPITETIAALSSELAAAVKPTGQS